MAANERTNVKIYPTALSTDVLFYVLADWTLPKNKNPTYGTSYRECLPHAAENFPDHELVFIAPADGSGQQKWYFAAKRENQDIYNFEFSKADIGSHKFDSVMRTYLTPRSSFTPNIPAMGYSMPDIPIGLFPGEFILVEKGQTRTGERELDSLYVAESHLYVKRCTITNLGVDQLNGKMLSSKSTIHYGSEVMIPGMTETQSFDVSGTLAPDATGSLTKVEDIVDGADSYPQFSTESDGVTFPATRVYYNGTGWVLSCHTTASTIPYALWISDPCTLASVPNPCNAAGWTPSIGVAISDPTGIPVFTDTTAYVQDITMAQLIDLPENSYWGLQSDGTQRTGQQLSCGWYSVSSETVVSGEMIDGVIGIDTYTTNDDFSWPAVLDYYNDNPWPRRDGGIDYAPVVKFKPEAYRGPCLTTITRTWSKEPFDIPKVEQMLPTSIDFSTPIYTVHTGECLHGAISFSSLSGTSHPVYKLVNQTDSFPETNHLTWPPTIVAYDDQVPFRGGFLRTRRVVSKPE